MHKFHELLLTFFFFGHAKKAPGTVGSAVTVVFWYFITSLLVTNGVNVMLQTLFWLVFSIIAFFYGVFASPIYVKSLNLDNTDHKSIVLDEVVGQIIALQISYFYLFDDFFTNITITSYQLIISFILFRFFDIYKPSIIGIIDKKLKNGLGVMVDDVISGICAGWLVVLIWWIVL